MSHTTMISHLKSVVYGSALSSPLVMKHADAVLSVYVPGEANGDAIADVLLGEAEPSGALPHTVYTPGYVDRVDFLDHSWRTGLGRGDRYIRDRSCVMLPFGYGLGYSAFNLSLDAVSPPGNGGGGGAQSASVAVSVTNTGRRTASKVVAVMLRERHVAMPLRANRWLGAFDKAKDVAPGETRSLLLRISPERWSAYDGFSGTWKPKPGQYEVMLLQDCCPLCGGEGCPACTCPDWAATSLEFSVCAPGEPTC